MRSLLICFLIVLSSLSLCAASSSEDNDLAHGKLLLENGLYTLALQHFQEALANNPGNLNISFYMGRAFFALTQYESAIMAYERVLIMTPKATRVKLEMARCYMGLGAYPNAQKYFQEVLETNPPDQVKKNINGYLEIISSSEKKHIFSGMISLGGSYDDNIRTSPTSSLIRTVSEDIILTGDSAESEAEWISSVTTTLSHSYVFAEKTLAWQSSGLFYGGYYKDSHDLNINYFGLNTGLVYKGEKILWKNLLIGKHLELEHERYLGTGGLESQFSFHPSKATSISLKGQFEDKTYFNDRLKDGHNYKLGLSPSITFDKFQLKCGLRQEWENTKTNYYDYEKLILQLDLNYSLPFGFSISGSYKYQESEYEEAEELFSEPREDKIHDYSASLTRPIWKSKDKNKRVLGQLSHSFTDSESNIDLYTYEKNVSTITFTFIF